MSRYWGFKLNWLFSRKTGFYVNMENLVKKVIARADGPIFTYWSGCLPLNLTWLLAKKTKPVSGDLSLFSLKLSVVKEKIRITKPRDQRVMWLYGWELLTVEYHSGNFDDHRHRVSRDLMFLVCHMTLFPTWLNRYVN